MALVMVFLTGVEMKHGRFCWKLFKCFLSDWKYDVTAVLHHTLT